MPLLSGQAQGVIAQLGERYNGIVEVGGSTPPGSTRTYLFNPSSGQAIIFYIEIQHANVFFLTCFISL